VPLTAARAALFGDAAIAPLGPPVCEVMTLAKRDLNSGELLDGIGGFTCYGVLENRSAFQSAGYLPMGVSEGCRLRESVSKDEPITYDNVELPTGRLIDKLRAEQNALFACQTGDVAQSVAGS
jgi:predicted homoserine dehydrogenase-like protein